ncbi:hypothetical protein JYP52_21535 [Nitratireductor aquibiodomus]|uniref:hypothetical protein n=1 Tax=Nitratireductor aquibiodomus TaxID=204799 RepID=UPI0019D3B728|nr:hypothetical protein [Nitratireductor aquibiodomus]MBN7763725.1 hypothetical protein [Nitratireductor aquibiodomus]
MTVPFQQEIENPLFEQTDWDDHQVIVVGVHEKYRFNDTSVTGLIRIIKPDDDTLGDVESFKDLFGDEIVTDSAGARRLAKTLLEAADAADALSSK